MSALPVSVTVELVPQQCGECHVWFGMDRQLRERRLRDHALWYCPNGHARQFVGETEEAKLRRELEHMTATADRNRDLRDYYKHSARTYRGHLTRVRKRVGNGVCPCCQRTFENLSRHMKSKHPAYGEPPK